MIKLIFFKNNYYLVDTESIVAIVKTTAFKYMIARNKSFKSVNNERELFIATNFIYNEDTESLDGINKVIGTTNPTDYDYLNVSQINQNQIDKLLGKTDKALGYINEYYKSIAPLNIDDLSGEQLAIYKAYKQAEQDNSKNIFTIEDMEHCFNEARRRTQHPDWDMIFDDFQDFCDKTISNSDSQMMEWEAEIKTTRVSPDKHSQTQFKPYDSIEILSLTPIKY